MDILLVSTDVMNSTVLKIDRETLLRLFPSPILGDDYTILTGNQHNPSCRWDMDKLRALSDFKLLQLYYTITGECDNGKL